MMAPFRTIARLGLLLTLIGTSGPALAATASELFADGNRLFREDLYYAALLRFREAAEAGMDTPLLHYNTGIAHYKAGQHSRARQSLEKAAAYGPLSAISHYNLGLNAWKLGDYDEALSWMRRAANQEDRRDIARLARRAIRQFEEEQARLNPVLVAQAEIVERDKEFAHLDLRMRTGVGMDDNVFRAPSEPYIDFADPNAPLVVPEVYSGMYIPVSLRALYRVNAYENEGFFGSYRFGGRFYNDPQLNNADEFLQEVAFGSEYGSRDEDRSTRVYSAFKIAQHDENYYDPDNGNYRVVNGEDVSNRMNYLRYGPEFWGQKGIGRYTFGFRAIGRLYNYEDVTQVPEYDHEYWLLGLNTQIRLSPTSLLRLNADYYTRRYGERPSFELDGTQPLGNTPVRYDYLEFSIEARQRITRSFWFGIGYSRTDREDRHVGYNSYVRDEYSMRFNLRLGQRFSLEATGRFFNYNFENAFAFHDPLQGRKTMERTMGTMTAAFAMTEHFDLVAEFFYRDTTTNDTRLAYDRTQAMLGLRWSP